MTQQTDRDGGQSMGASDGWADPRLARVYFNLEAISETLSSGSTEQGCIREAMNEIELADQYVEQRKRETQ